MTMMDTKTHLLTKAARAGETKVLDDATGIVEALVAVTGNVDDGGDIIEPGAFAYPDGRLPKVVWSHDLNVLVGKVLGAEELKPGDARLPSFFSGQGFGGLLFRVQFDLADPDGFKAYRKVAFHQDMGWSIGYEVPIDGFKVDAQGLRHLSKVVVWEASPVTFGMNKEARTMSVKSLSETKYVSPPLAGSVEERQSLISDALDVWATATMGERVEGNWWYVSIDGTFDDRVIATVRSPDDTTEHYSFPYILGPAGVELAPPVQVELTTVVSGDVQSADTTTITGVTGHETLDEEKQADDEIEQKTTDSESETLSMAELLEFESLTS